MEDVARAGRGAVRRGGGGVFTPTLAQLVDGLLLVGLGDGVDVGFLLAGGLAAGACSRLDDDVRPAAVGPLVPLVPFQGLFLATHLVRMLNVYAALELEAMLAARQLLRALMAAAVQQAQLLLDLLDAVLDLLGQVEVA